MLVPYEWLNSFVKVSDIPAPELADKLSRTGLEVEGIRTLNDGLKKVVVGETLSVEPHPDSDHLSICQVNVGDDEPLQIVCGAPNVAARQKVIVALQNSWIAGHQKIKKGKMRGVSSYGMICALDEIGFSADVVPKEFAEGIMVLPDDAPVGIDIVEYLGMDEPILDIDVTPNRGDALSMHGVAYEVGAMLERPVQIPPIDTDGFVKQPDRVGDFEITVPDVQLVPEYNALLVKDVTIQSSPLWMQLRLMKAGVNPINNVVDITNYVLLETGHPLHAFDADTITSKRLEARAAEDGETLVTLDEESRTLAAGDIVITDGKEPIALAGVKGGLSTSITEQTKNVLIEAAVFALTPIRKAARRLGIPSDTSMRNERGVNRATTLASGVLAAQLMVQYAGGTIDTRVFQQTVLNDAPVLVSTTLDYINRLLGLDIDFANVRAIFDRLGFGIAGDAQDFTVSVPPRRWDITIPADLAEEVARFYGYDKITSRLPELKTTQLALTPEQTFVNLTHRTLQALGFDEVVSYSLTTQANAQPFAKESKPTLVLKHPASDDRSVLRVELLPSLLAVAQYNRARHTEPVKIYELGNVYWQADDSTPIIKRHLAGLWTGNANEKTWQHDVVPVDFYALKGDVETYLSATNVDATFRFVADTERPGFHPGQTATIVATTTDGTEHTIGAIGRLHPETAAAYDLPDETYGFELSLAELLELSERTVAYTPTPRYPGSHRDIALIVKEDVSNQAIVDVIKANGAATLTSVTLFDVYRDAQIGAGYKSLAYGLEYLDPNATLVDTDVNANVDAITRALEASFDAKIR